MNKRKVRLFSFFIFMSFLFAFRGWGGVERYHISEFTILMVFIFALFTYIKILEHLNKLRPSNEIIKLLRLNGLISFLKEGNEITILKEVLFFSLSIFHACWLCIFIQHHNNSTRISHAIYLK